jgi:hypothetical protein
MDKEKPSLGIASFDEWLGLWNASEKMALRLGLLQDLQKNDRAYDKHSAVPFLLKQAEGHAGHIPESLVYTYHDPKYQKLRIAKKACTVLCVRFFKSADDRIVEDFYQDKSWAWMLDDREVFDALVNFFVSGKDVRNIPVVTPIFKPSHEAEVLLQFLHNFIRLCFEYEIDEDFLTLNPESKKLLFDAQPKAVRLLHALGELPYLVGKKLDPASIDVLIEIAMSGEYVLPPEKEGEMHTRKPRCLEDAVLGGSVAASIVALQHIVDRQERIIAGLFAKNEQQLKAKLDDVVQRVWTD